MEGGKVRIAHVCGIAGMSIGTSQRYIFAMGTIATGRCANVFRYFGRARDR